MYDYLKGPVTRITPEYIVLEVNGVGWQLYTPNPFAFRINNLEQQIYVHMHVREDAQLLFGFTSLDQRELFRKLILVSGIGPKGALAILASGQVQAVVQAIEHEDEKFLLKFPGVGKKTARQMILDLKGKLENIVPDYFPNLFNDALETTAFGNNDQLEEAMEALKALGYSEREITKARKVLEQESKTTEEYIKAALQLLLK